MSEIKQVRTEGYNYYFNRKTGVFGRWGKTVEEDPQFSPLGPEILDLEVSTICNGLGKPCSFCYKTNTARGQNMSIETFKAILDKMPTNLTQIAFGIGDIDSNPDLFKMFEYCRSHPVNPVVPNVTTNGYRLTDELADKLVSLCGAVAVSRYQPKDVCYDAVKKLTDRGMKQTNIHMLLSETTYEQCMEAIEDYLGADSRLEKLNAIVFLFLKPKGGRNKHEMLKSMEKYENLIRYALSKDVPIGFDSCGAPLFERVLEKMPHLHNLKALVEPCESSLFSSYINVEGQYFPCSFTEGEPGIEGIDVISAKDFLKDVWFNEKTVAWRAKLLGACRHCPQFCLYDLN